MVSAERVLGDRYRLEERIAAGAMGVVHRAHDTRLERAVAVKVLSDAIATDQHFIERFRREARAAAALSHPNIAAVYDYGEDEGFPYIVMELVEGQDLAEVLRVEGPLDLDRARRIAAQVADALGHAHAADLVHRDVKPGNILLAGGDRVKVTDLGIARAAGSATLTVAGSMLGTANYVSPEQASGAEVTPRSDVYSLGIVLYEMLTGRVPFAGDNPLAVAAQHTTKEVPPPSWERPEVPEILDDIVRTATQREPALRYRDAGAFAAALRGTGPASAAPTLAMAGEAPTEELPPPPPITGSWQAQKVGRAVFAVAALLLLLAVGGGVWRFLQADRTAPAEREPVETTEATVTTVREDEQVGAAAVVVPDELVGRSYEDSVKRIEAAGLETARVDITDADAPENTVLRVEPEEGSEVTEGDTITLFVSAPEETDTPGASRGKGNAKGKGKKE